jgi:glucokinase
MYSIGVDIGGSHITSCMFEHTNKTLDRKTLVHKKVDTKAHKNVIIDDWVSTIAKTIECSGKNVEGIGIAMPGPFNYYEGISLISEVNKFDALYKVNIRKELAAELKIEPSKIRFINDASAFSIAEALVGHASNFQKVVAITLGTGFGSSFLYNGLPIIDATNVPKGGFLYNKSYQGKPADDIFSTRGILNHYKEISGKAIENVRELTERAAYDKSASDVFCWFGMELGKFLAPYLLDFEAEILVLGGNISKANPLFIQDLKEQMPKTEIYISKFGEEAAIIGSALLLEDDFYKKLLPTLKLM